MQVGARIKAIQETCFSSQIEMAKFFDVSQGTLSNWVKGRHEPPYSVLLRLHKDFDISLDWLITGRGEMKGGAEAPVVVSDAAAERELAGEGFVLVPLLDDVRASAGGGAFVDGEGASRKLAFRNDFISHHNITKNTLTAITVTGDSMHPTLLNGDTILVDHSQTRPLLDRIYIFRIGETIVVKRFGGFDGSKVLLKSDNQAVGNTALESSATAIIGRCVWFGRVI